MERSSKRGVNLSIIGSPNHRGVQGAWMDDSKTGYDALVFFYRPGWSDQDVKKRFAYTVIEFINKDLTYLLAVSGNET